MNPIFRRNVVAESDLPVVRGQRRHRNSDGRYPVDPSVPSPLAGPDEPQPEPGLWERLVRRLWPCRCPGRHCANHPPRKAASSTDETAVSA